jgi:hypothetical protein
MRGRFEQTGLQCRHTTPSRRIQRHCLQTTLDLYMRAEPETINRGRRLRRHGSNTKQVYAKIRLPHSVRPAMAPCLCRVFSEQHDQTRLHHNRRRYRQRQQRHRGIRQQHQVRSLNRRVCLRQHGGTHVCRHRRIRQGHAQKRIRPHLDRRKPNNALPTRLIAPGDVAIQGRIGIRAKVITGL